MNDMKRSRGNYRKGGLIMLPFVLVGLLIAYLLAAPLLAMVSIGVCGFGCAIILIAIGDKRKSIDEINM